MANDRNIIQQRQIEFFKKLFHSSFFPSIFIFIDCSSRWTFPFQLIYLYLCIIKFAKSIDPLMLDFFDCGEEETFNLLSTRVLSTHDWIFLMDCWINEILIDILSSFCRIMSVRYQNDVTQLSTFQLVFVLKSKLRLYFLTCFS